MKALTIQAEFSVVQLSHYVLVSKTVSATCLVVKHGNTAVLRLLNEVILVNRGEFYSSDKRMFYVLRNVSSPVLPLIKGYKNNIG